MDKTNYKFKYFFFVIIILNAILQMCYYWRSPYEYEMMLDYINLGFLIIFFIEVLLRLIAQGKLYFVD